MKATGLTAEEFVLWPGDRPCELIDGEVIEYAFAGGLHGATKASLGATLHRFAVDHDAGAAALSVGYILRRDPDCVRSLDISVLTTEQLKAAPEFGFPEFAPRLAVEIVSPEDTWTGVWQKTHEFLDAGTAAVWIVDPSRASVHVATTAGVQILDAESSLVGGEALPGFELSLGRFFAELHG